MGEPNLQTRLDSMVQRKMCDRYCAICYTYPIYHSVEVSEDVGCRSIEILIDRGTHGLDRDPKTAFDFHLFSKPLHNYESHMGGLTLCQGGQPEVSWRKDPRYFLLLLHYT
jgi:hypothetical protein